MAVSHLSALEVGSWWRKVGTLGSRDNWEQEGPASADESCSWSYLARITEAAVSQGLGDSRRSEHMNTAGQNRTKGQQ